MSNLVTADDFILQQEQSFNAALTTECVSWVKESQFACQLLRGNDFLTKTAERNPNSLRDAIINVAAIGISLNPAEKRAYLVPRDGRVCLDVSYMGLMHIATTEGSIEWGQAKIVYANDTYENQGLTKEPVHRYNAFGDRGNAIGCYCTVKLPTGDYMTEEMSMEQIHDTRNRSKAWQAWVNKKKSCPWVTDELEMWRKTVVKRASKYWPQPQKSRLNQAVHMLNEVNDEGLEKTVLASSEQKEKLLEICELMGKDFNEALKVINAKREDKFECVDDVHYDSMQKFLDWASTMANYFNNYSSMLEALENEDEQYIFECIEELTEEDQFYVWRAYTKFGFIPGEKQKELREIHRKVKAEQA